MRTLDQLVTEMVSEQIKEDTTRLANLLIGATAKRAQAVWREAEQLGIGDQVRRAWLDKMAVDIVVDRGRPKP